MRWEFPRLRPFESLDSNFLVATFRLQKNANSELFFWKFSWSEVGPWSLHFCKLLRWFLNDAIVSYYLTLLVVAYF